MLVGGSKFCCKEPEHATRIEKVSKVWHNGKKLIVFLLWSLAQWLRRCITKPTVVGSILADATAFAAFVSFSKVLNLDCLFPTQDCAEAFILQWIDTAWNLFFYLFIVAFPVTRKIK